MGTDASPSSLGRSRLWMDRKGGKKTQNFSGPPPVTASFNIFLSEAGWVGGIVQENDRLALWGRKERDRLRGSNKGIWKGNTEDETWFKPKKRRQASIRLIRKVARHLFSGARTGKRRRRGWRWWWENRRLLTHLDVKYVWNVGQLPSSYPAAPEGKKDRRGTWAINLSDSVV